MRRYLLLILILAAFIAVITLNMNDHKLNILALGDSVAAGQTPNNEIDKSYNDYLVESLSNQEKVSNFNKDFIDVNYTTSKLLKDINDNIEVKGHNIQNQIKQANIITISIGLNDFVNELKSITSVDETYISNLIDSTSSNIIEIIKTIRNINPKTEIYLIGYYSPMTKEHEYNTILSKKLVEADNKLQEASKQYNYAYIQLYEFFKENTQYFPSKESIYPSLEGYKKIAEVILDSRKNLLNK